MGEERERNRVRSRVDELPNEIRELLHKRLADVNYTYQEIADEITELGFEISKSSIGRYALRQGGAAKRLKESAEKIRALAEVVKENRDIESSEIAGAILMDALIERVSMAQEEIDNMPLDKAGRLIVAMQRSAVYKEKFKLEYKKGYKEAIARVKAEIADELKKEPELLIRMSELVIKAESKINTSD